MIGRGDPGRGILANPCRDPGKVGLVFPSMTLRPARSTLALLALALLGGCASTSGPAKLGDDGAANMDLTARRVAVDYRDRCFEPVAKRKVPSDLCQFQLFERAERQWGSEFGKTELLQTANRIQGDLIETAIMKILVYDKAAQRYVSSNKQTRYELVQQLKDKYKIR